MGGSQLDSLVEKALAEFSSAGDPASLEDAKARYLGKAGGLNAFRPAQGTPEEK